MTVCLVASEQDLPEVQKDILPRLNYSVCLLRWPEDAECITDFTDLLIFLSDEHLRQLLDRAAGTELTLHPLPHDDAVNSRRGFCLDKSLAKSELDLAQRQTQSLDLLRCDNQIVLNKVVVGRAFNFQPGGHSRNAWQRAKTAGHQLFRIHQYVPKAISLKTGKESSLKTAAVGVMCSPHVLQSNLSRKLLPENYVNDGMFYSLVVAPKSLTQMLRFFVMSLFERNLPQPGFLGILRSQSLVLESPEEIDCRADEREFKARSLSLWVDEGAIKLGLEPDSQLLQGSSRHKEVRRLKALNSSAEYITGIANKPLPLITHAATEDFKELYLQMREAAQLSSTFLTLMVLSTLLAGFGLYADSAPVIIGAMILAPLMSPIVSLSMAITRQDEGLLLTSGKTLALGTALAVLCAMLLSFMLPLEVVTSEIGARLRPTLLDLGIAVISGTASAFAYARSQAAKGLAGVAIAVALVPPLAVTGIGLGWLSWSVASGALLLFITNLAGIVFSAAATFLMLGFAPFNTARRGLILSLLLVALVSVPLAFSFNQLRKEATIVSALDLFSFEGVTLGQIKVLSVSEPVQLSMEMVISENPAEVDLPEVKRAIEARVGEPVVMDVIWVIRY
ncbi:TIGR00341 family protein [Reinekea marinisedimentorum]|uniref:Putative hydrophobic protein (TIGR00341 family) n=1 Tax=Reinekea marinisedimentorum TaxID=230495 RepID=A0A4R3I648_9GAMM|nr:TIGR00341 family protein [Reinekea marinisedimentorum]TCS41168.1 putative hydrophobic protein (TIGR00341 family) [Reinekea marinisedimentorum]